MKFRIAILVCLLAGCSSDPVDQRIDADTNAVDMSESDSGNAPDAATADAANNVAADMSDVDAPGPVDQGELTSGWHERADLPNPQQEVAVVEIDGLIYVMGGFNELGQQLATVVVYDPSTDRWSERADFPDRANHMNAVAVDGQIWVTGFLSNGFNADPRTFVYDPGTDSWAPGPDMSDARGRGASAVGFIDGLIYVAGGIGPDGVTAMVDVLDPATETWTPLTDALRAFDHAGYGVVDGKLIVAAGRSGSIQSFFTDVQIYDPAADSWSAGAPIPTARGGVASAVHDGILYVFGGEGDSGSPGSVFPDVEAYDVAADSWTVLDPMLSPRHGFAGVALGDIIYLPGGAPTQFLDAVATHEIFVP